jgi:hypothetical protein
VKRERKRIAENGHSFFPATKMKEPWGDPRGSRYAHAHNADEQQSDDRPRRIAKS